MTKTRRPQERVYQRMKVAELYLSGWLQSDIAAELGINQSTVSRDLKWLTTQWLAEASLKFDEAKARELAKINRLEMEYWEAWKRSCVERSEKYLNERQRQQGTEKQKSMKTVSRDGDVKYLNGIERCIQLRCQLLGLYEPTKINLSGDKDNPVPLLVLKNVSVNDL